MKSIQTQSPACGALRAAVVVALGVVQGLPRVQALHQSMKSGLQKRRGKKPAGDASKPSR